MKTADNQSLSAAFLFIRTVNRSRIPHLTGGEMGGFGLHIKTSPSDWIILHQFSAFCIKQTLFRTHIFAPSKKGEYDNAEKLFYDIAFPEGIKVAKKWRGTNLYVYHNEWKVCRGINRAKCRCYRMEYVKRMRDWQGKEISRNKPLF